MIPEDQLRGAPTAAALVETAAEPPVLQEAFVESPCGGQPRIGHPESERAQMRDTADHVKPASRAMLGQWLPL